VSSQTVGFVEYEVLEEAGGYEVLEEAGNTRCSKRRSISMW